MFARNWNKLALGAAVLTLTIPGIARADLPKDRPVAMRGVELGITIGAFRQIAVPNDGGRHFDLQTWCNTDPAPRGEKLLSAREDRAAGIVDCKWFSRSNSSPMISHWEHWIDIGSGKGIPTFRFAPIDGELRLFRISFYANIEYYPGILDALTRGYGSALTTVAPFQTLAGSQYTSATSVWNNGLSSITLVQRCGHLERYCLTYDHTAYAKLYEAIEEKRAAEAAGKI